jgi:hypothetical protein
MRRKKKVSGAADFIIPIAVVLGGGYVVYTIGQKIGLWGTTPGSDAATTAAATATTAAATAAAAAATAAAVKAGATPAAATAAGNVAYTATANAGQSSISLQSSSSTVQQQTLTLQDTATTFYKNQPTATNPFEPDLYNSNNACPSIAQADAVSLWSDLKTAYNGSGFISIFKAQPDMSPVLGEFQAVVQSACDISWVSALCMAETGIGLGDWLFNSFSNDQTGTSGQTNMQMLYAFLQWGFSLPVGTD